MATGEKSFNELWLLVKDPSRGTLPSSQINMTNDFQMTLLHCAARDGDWRAAMMLIQKDANLFLTDRSNRTVLHFAVMRHCFFAFMLAQEIAKYTDLDFRPMLILALNEIAASDPGIDSIMVRQLICILPKIPLEYFKGKHLIEILPEMRLDAATIDKYLPEVIAILNPHSVLSTQSLCQSLEKMAVQGSNLARRLHLQILKETMGESERPATFIVVIKGTLLTQIYLRTISTPKIYYDSPILSKPAPSDEEDEDILTQSNRRHAHAR